MQTIAQLIDCARLRRLDKDTCTTAERRHARAWLREMAEEAAQEEEEEEEVEEEQARIYSAVHAILSFVFDMSSMLWFSQR